MGPALALMILFLTGEKVGPLNGFQILGLETFKGHLKVISYEKLN